MSDKTIEQENEPKLEIMVGFKRGDATEYEFLGGFFHDTNLLKCEFQKCIVDKGDICDNCKKLCVYCKDYKTHPHPALEMPADSDAQSIMREIERQDEIALYQSEWRDEIFLVIPLGLDDEDENTMRVRRSEENKKITSLSIKIRQPVENDELEKIGFLETIILGCEHMNLMEFENLKHELLKHYCHGEMEWYFESAMPAQIGWPAVFLHDKERKR